MCYSIINNSNSKRFQKLTSTIISVGFKIIIFNTAIHKSLKTFLSLNP